MERVASESELPGPPGRETQNNYNKRMRNFMIEEASEMKQLPPDMLNDSARTLTQGPGSGRERTD